MTKKFIRGAALATLLARDGFASEAKPEAAAVRGLAGLPHFAPKAKRVIYLFQSGAPSQIDLFDPKPKLGELDMREFERERSRFASAMASGRRYYVKSPFAFRQTGGSGMWMNTLFEELAAFRMRSRGR